MISENLRQVKECKTDLSPEGSSSSRSIDSNIKGKRNFVLHSTNRIQQSRVEQEVQWPASGPKALQKIKTKEYKACLQKKSKSRDTLQNSHPRAKQPLSLGAYCRRSG